MMFKLPQQMHTDDLFEMTAMVDVVFILLTFFIISAQMFGDEHDVAMRYQRAAQSQGLAVGDLPLAVVISLRNLNPKQVGIRIGQREMRPNDYQSITNTLAQINLPQLPVVVQAQGNVLIQDVANAVNAVLSSPMKQISLSPPPGSYSRNQDDGLENSIPQKLPRMFKTPGIPGTLRDSPKPATLSPDLQIPSMNRK